MSNKSESFEDYISKVYLPEFEPIRVENIEHAWDHQEQKLQAERDKVALLKRAVEFNKVFLAYALEERYQWDRDFLKDVSRNIKAFEKLKELEGKE